MQLIRDPVDSLVVERSRFFNDIYGIGFNAVNIIFWVVWRHNLVKNKNISNKRKMIEQIRYNKKCPLFRTDREFVKSIINSIWK